MFEGRHEAFEGEHKVEMSTVREILNSTTYDVCYIVVVVYIVLNVVLCTLPYITTHYSVVIRVVSCSMSYIVPCNL